MMKKKKQDKKKKTENKPTLPPIQLLVIDSDDKNWYKCFDGVTSSKGRPFKIIKCRWESMVVSSSTNGKAMVDIKPNEKPLPDTDENQVRRCQPDFVLVRKLVRGLVVGAHDYTNALYGLLFAGLPAVNSLESVHACLERPVVMAALNGIKKKLGKEVFPLINQSYYSNQQAMLFTPEYPIVVKVGYAEAGYGKMKFDEQSQLNDFRGVLALHQDYVTAEEFVPNREYDLRIQKIGKHYRAYKRISSNWKGNVGSSHIEEIPMTKQFETWAEEAGKLFGGMDILTVDAIHTKDGEDYILEINDTASGFYGKNEAEDMEHVKELILEKWNNLENQ